jgi:hypothetical protein
MTFIRHRRAVATIVAASCIAAPAAASADQPPSLYRSDAAQSDSAGALPSTDRSDAAQSGSAGSLPPTDRSDAAQSGSTAGNQAGAKVAYPPAGFNGGDRAQSQSTGTSTFPAAGFRGGDTPADHPGASRAPSATPTTIEVVRPERTIVRDVDEALPLILSSTALLLVLAGLGITLIRTRMLPRPGASR